jgi:predicted DNA-binding transcriptional regulator AlpA
MLAVIDAGAAANVILIPEGDARAFPRRINRMTKLLFHEDVSELTRVPIATLRYWRHIGKGGPKSFKIGNRVAYKLEDVEAWIEAQYEDAGRVG